MSFFWWKIPARTGGAGFHSGHDTARGLRSAGIPVFCKITEIIVIMHGKRYIIMIINLFRSSVILPSLYFPWTIRQTGRPEILNFFRMELISGSDISVASNLTKMKFFSSSMTDGSLKVVCSIALQFLHHSARKSTRTGFFSAADFCRASFRSWTLFPDLSALAVPIW